MMVSRTTVSRLGTCLALRMYELQNNDNSSNAGNAATTLWRNSAGHYKNMMGINYWKLGLGYVRCSGGRVYWTGVLGA